MKIFDITVNGREFRFVCSSRNTRHGFAHDCTLFVNGDDCGESHCYYLNRTWESWGFQSVCIAAINKELQEREMYNRAKWMFENGYKKMTSTRKAAFLDTLRCDPYYVTCTIIKKKLNEGRY